jgi:hypothetical protein
MLKTTSFAKILLFLFYTFIFLFLVRNSYSYLDPDLGWHLKVGEQISIEKSVPHVDYYDYTLKGQRWVDHEWLSNTLLYWLNANFGYLSLNLLFVLVFMLSLWIINLTAKHFFIEKAHPFYIIIFQALGLMGCLPHLGVRVQELSVLLLAVLFYQLYLFEKTKNIKALIALPILFYFWACLHAGFLIGLFIAFCWILIKAVEHVLNKTRYSIYFEFSFLSKKQFIQYLLILLLSMLATLLTPYRFELYSFLSDYKDSYYLTHISEWIPFYFFPIQYLKLLYDALVLTVFSLTVLFSITGHEKEKTVDNAPRVNFKINLWHIFLLGLLCFMAMKSMRHFPLLFIASYPIILKFFCDLLGRFPQISFLQNKRSFFIECYLITAVILLIILQSVSIRPIKDPFQEFCQEYPCSAIKFLRANKQYDSSRLLNFYDWGGFMIWTYPEKKLFIDGRLSQYKFNNWTLMQEYHDFFRENRGAILLDKYNIRLVHLKGKNDKITLNWFEKDILMMNEDEMNKNENYLKNFLDGSKKWKLVFQDKISLLYAKNP